MPSRPQRVTLHKSRKTVSGAEGREPVSAEEDITEELVRLRRGWGLQDRNLRARIGPKLAVLGGITDADSDRDVREKVRRWLDARRDE